MLVDFHVHTCYSPDAVIRLEDIVSAWKHKGLVCAITDHNTIRACLEAKKLNIPFIPGEEILCKEGEIIGLFIQEPIPSGLTLEEAIDLIREQDGVVYAPHPFDFRRAGVGEIARLADIVEIANGRRLFVRDVNAEMLAQTFGLLKAGGSDAHLPWELGKVVCRFEGIEVEKGILEKREVLKQLEYATIEYSLWPPPLPLKLFRR